MASPFQITFLCTANQARSAIAQECARRAMANHPVEVESAGVRGVTGRPALDHAVAAARLLGIDLSSHRSACLADVGLSRSDLVLGFELQHVATAVVEGGASAERAFTLKEFLRLADNIEDGSQGSVETARNIVERAHLRRLEHATFVGGEEIADPVTRSRDYFEAAFREICSLSEVLAECLFGARSR